MYTLLPKTVNQNQPIHVNTHIKVNIAGVHGPRNIVNQLTSLTLHMCMLYGRKLQNYKVPTNFVNEAKHKRILMNYVFSHQFNLKP